MSTRKTEHSIAADTSSQALRQRAEEKASRDESSAVESLSLDDARRMLHELQVHQIELKMQNDELRSTQHELETLRDSYFDLYDLAPVGYLTLSEQGLILQANLTAAAMFGGTQRDLHKKLISSFFLREDQDIYNLHRNKVFEADDLQSWEMRMARTDGSLFWAKLRATPAHNGEYRITVIDITGHKQAEAERAAMTLQQEGVNLLLQSLLKPAPLETKLAGITDGIVRYFDADFCRIWLIRPGDLCESACMHAEVTEGPHVCRHRDRCLHLLASSGRYTHIDGKVHRRVPFGCYKIGRIASGEEHKFLTNNVDNDPRIHDHKWAHKLGLVSFAGYQLRVPEGETIGVLALFSRRPIFPSEDAMLDGLSSAVALTV
jgi:PAS domain S-box-containing protein